MFSINGRSITVLTAASGSDAAPTRLTAAAPSIVAPAALKKFLRLVML